MDERELLIRTVLGEAGNQSPAGQAAVVYSALNRVGDPRYGNSLGQVITPATYNAWANPRKMMSYSPGSDGWAKAADVVDAVLGGRMPDPTGGATHYYNPTLQSEEGRPPPNWAKGSYQQIGAHRFYGGQTEGTDLLGSMNTVSPQPQESSAAEGSDLLGRMSEEPTAPAQQVASTGSSVGVPAQTPAQIVASESSAVPPSNYDAAQKLRLNYIEGQQGAGPTDRSLLGLLPPSVASEIALHPYISGATAAAGIPAAAIGARAAAGGALPLASLLVGEKLAPLALRLTGAEAVDQATGGRLTGLLMHLWGH